ASPEPGREQSRDCLRIWRGWQRNRVQILEVQPSCGAWLLFGGRLSHILYKVTRSRNNTALDQEGSNGRVDDTGRGDRRPCARWRYLGNGRFHPSHSVRGGARSYAARTPEPLAHPDDSGSDLRPTDWRRLCREAYFLLGRKSGSGLASPVSRCSRE